MIWRVDREMILLLGGGRALLMQLAHPKVAAGVSDHSHFRENPLGRLHRTMNTMWSIVFDEAAQAHASLERVNEIHRQVQGTIRPEEPLPTGTPYRALEPDLLLWVHATLVDSAIRAYDLFVRPMSTAERNRYYDDTRKLACLFGVPEPDVPPSLTSFNKYVEQMLSGGTISVGRTALSLAQEILHPSPWILKMGGPIHSFVTTGLLPPSLREAYGLRWSDRRERALAILARTIRCSLPLLPRPLRIVPHARAAEKRRADQSRRRSR
ncbi:MAG: oxygenase MpaB family protein [Candidatus Binatia bacterium]